MMAKRLRTNYNQSFNIYSCFYFSSLLCFILFIGLSGAAKHRLSSYSSSLSSQHLVDDGGEAGSVVNFRRTKRTAREGSDNHFIGKSRLKRSTSDQSGGADSKNRTTVYALDDHHATLVVHWEGEGSDIIIALAKNPSADTTSLYFSLDYGKTFEKKDDKLKIDESTAAIIHQFYNSTDDYIFTDIVHSCLFITRDDGKSFERICNLPFKPTKLLVNPYNHRRILGIDPSSNSKELYISEDFGRTWEFLYSSVKEFFWGVYPHDGRDYQDTVYIHESVNKAKGQLIKALVRHSQTPRFTPLADDVIKASVYDSYIYVVKSVNLLGPHPNPRLQLWVSYDRGQLRNSEFPIDFNELNITEYYVVDMSEDQVMVCVSVNSSFTNLYISEVKGHRFTLSLEKIVFFNPESTNRQSWIRFYTNKTFADITKVAGVPGVYIASQQIGNLLDIDTQRTLISFDKGGKWEVISPPERVLSLHPEACAHLNNCSLHLTQEFSQFYPLSGSSPILSEKSAPGLILASGMLGTTLKTNADVFVSSDAGLTWDEALSGNYLYAMGDFGGILVAIETEVPTNEVMFSVDEGQTWHGYIFYPHRINVYGLLTEPGEKTSVFSIFGSAMTKHSWIVIQIDFKDAFENKVCTPEDYKWWSFGESQKDKNWCLLGRLTKYQKRVRNSICFNGHDFVRQKTVENCSCIAEDFECDYGYEPRYDGCTPITGFDASELHPIPDPCPEGTFYPYSRGYRKVAGDTCQGGKEHQLGPLMYSCPLNERKDFLLVNMGRKTAIVNLDDSSVLDITLPGGDSASLATFDYKENCEIYVDSERALKQFCLGNKEDSRVDDRFGPQTEMHCLAFDWTARNVYLCNHTNSVIFVRSTVNPFQRRLYNASHGIRSPRSLVVDPSNGYMFFVDKINSNGNDHYGIFRASMDGSDAKVTLVANATHVSSHTPLTLELDSERLYWENKGKLLRSDYLGKNITVLSTNGPRLSSAAGIAIYKDNIYVTRLNSDTISVVNKNMPGWWSDFPVHGHLSGIKGLMVVSQFSQHAMSACSDFHKRCSQLCLPRPNPTTSDPSLGRHNRTCLCGVGYRIRRLDNGQDEACTCEAGETMTEEFICVKSGNTSSCGPDQHACNSKDECIYATWLCDGDEDCSDGSDEESCALRTCGDGLFTCANGKCILSSWRCDREDDCRDDQQSDEMGCGTQNCSNTQFQCDDGYCIHDSWRCDGDNDCHDFSDEKDCGNNVTSCRAWEIQCKDGNCISSFSHCNGIPDCPDSSDEEDCDGHENNCTAWEFSCGDGHCINMAWVCDGMDDCDNGSDEKLNCTSPSFTTVPPHSYNCDRPDAYRCKDQTCIPLFYVCNGINDCGDNEDEMACGSRPTVWPWTTMRPMTTPGIPGECLAHEYMCMGNTSSSSSQDRICLWRAWLCDGEKDCPLGDDEKDCNRDCDESSFYCLFDGNCIPQSKVCDGHFDCQDETDEHQNCLTTLAPRTNYSCPTDHFPCQDSKQSCVPFTAVCNTAYDCKGNRHDEEDCDECDGFGLVTVSSYGHRDCMSTDCPASVWFVRTDEGMTLYWTKHLRHKIMVAYRPVPTSTSNSNMETFTKWDMNTVRGNKKLDQLEPATKYSFDFLVKLADGKLCPVGNTYQTTVNGISDVPRNVLVTARGNKDNPYILLSWKKPAKSNGAILTYLVFYHEMSDDLTHPVGREVKLSIEDFAFSSHRAPTSDSKHDYQFPLEGYFEWNKHYSLWMEAKTNAGLSEKTEKLTFFMSDKPDTHHNLDLNVKAVAVDNTTVRVTWKPDPLAVKYTVVGLSVGGQEQVTMAVDKSKTEAVVNDLCPGVTFTFSVHVSHGATAETIHSAKPVKLHSGDDGDRPPMAHQVTVEMTGPTSVMVTFTTPDSQRGLPNYIYYTTEGLNYQAKTSLVQPKSVILPGDAQTQREVKGLDACERYWLAVVPAHRTCPGYGVQTFVTLEDEKAPPKHVNARIIHTSGQSIVKLRLNWDASCYHLSRPLKYVVRVKIGKGRYNSFTTSTATSNSTMLNFELPEVIPGENYTLAVRAAVVGARESPPLHIHIPEEFTAWHLRVNRVAEKEVVLEWNWDDTTVPEFQTYIIKYRLAKDGPSVEMENRTKASRIDLKLPDLGIYHIKVAALAFDGVEVSSTRLQYDLFSKSRHSHDDDDDDVTLSKTHLVAIIAPVSVVVVILSAGIVFFMVRHRRLQRSFLAFANSHYNIQSGTTTFSEDLDGDEPLIQGFSDDEPLVIG